ncbi:MAG TPA: hypothetical protein VLX68_00335 [Chitinivibrionales bacterium]|nr:hypothetical protein [Chitinivibrionales bacterium]
MRLIELFSSYMKKGFVAALASAAFLFCSQVHAEICPALSVDPAVDAVMYRLATRYALPLPASFFTQPMTVCDVLSFLSKADSLSVRLSDAEKADIRELRKRISPDNALLHWKNKKHDAQVGVRLVLADTNAGSFGAKDAGYVRGTASPSLQAGLGPVSFYSGMDVWTDYRSDTMYHQSDYQPYNGLPYNLYSRADSSHARSSDLLRGGIVYIGSPFRLDVAVDKIKQGPALASPLTFSGDAPPETYLRGQLSFGFMEYIQAFGQLKSDKDMPKYFYTHRIQVPLFKNRFTAALTEVVINGSTTNEPHTAPDSANALRSEYYGVTRTWEIAYMIPFVPYAFMEHYLGDRDNKALSFDFNLSWPDDFRWYCEIFIDDFTTPWTILSDDWGNKWAFDVGAQYFTSLLSHDLTATAEYCRVEPWVYTHFFGGAARYDNFNVCLGAPLGPNSDLLFLSCESRVSLKNSAGLTFTNMRTNSSVRGGNIRDVFQDPPKPDADSPIKHFLGAGTQTISRIGAFWKFDQLGVFRAAVKYDYDFSGKSLIQVYGGLYF